MTSWVIMGEHCRHTEDSQDLDMTESFQMAVAERSKQIEDHYSIKANIANTIIGSFPVMNQIIQMQLRGLGKL